MRDGFKHEQDFWKGFVQTDRFKINWQGDGINPELHPDVVAIFKNEVLPFDPLKVADIGSGACSILHGLPLLDIQCVDPLGWYYAEIGCPGVISAGGEQLPFESDMFDVAHCSNAIDHSVNPMRVLAEMIRITKPFGLVIVQGFENEATHENRAGLHQYDMAVLGGTLLCTGKTSFSYSPESVLYCETKTLVTGRKWFIFVFRKTDNHAA